MPTINRIAAFHDEMTEWRRHLHAHPELAFEEFETSAFVATKLGEWGIEVHRGLGGTGVVGVLHGAAGPGNRRIGLRADMDALPMTEANSFAHASKIPGRMHGCGHDGHTTMLLGAAKYLAETRAFDGTVHFIFQPAEEVVESGARRMVQDGLFRRFPCDAVYGLHNFPPIPMGRAAVRQGPMMAAADEVRIAVTGKGGHAAAPHLAIDPVPAACEIVLALQRIVSRTIDPLDSCVISITMVRAGSAFNVIPETVTLGGTVRTLRPETRQRAEEEIRRVARAVAEAHGASAEVEFLLGHPATINHAREAEVATRAFERVLGEAAVIPDVPPTMGGEDFAYFLNEVPGAYGFLGQGGAGNCSTMVHNPTYDFNDAILPIGASFFAHVVEAELPRS